MSRRLGHGRRQFDAALAMEGLRQLVARVDALASATEDLFERVSWNSEDEDNAHRLEHLAHLLGATTETARAAVDVTGEIAAELDKNPGRS